MRRFNFLDKNVSGWSICWYAKPCFHIVSSDPVFLVCEIYRSCLCSLLQVQLSAAAKFTAVG